MFIDQVRWPKDMIPAAFVEVVQHMQCVLVSVNGAWAIAMTAHLNVTFMLMANVRITHHHVNLRTNTPI